MKKGFFVWRFWIFGFSKNKLCNQYTDAKFPIASVWKHLFWGFFVRIKHKSFLSCHTAVKSNTVKERKKGAPLERSRKPPDAGFKSKLGDVWPKQ